MREEIRVAFKKRIDSCRGGFLIANEKSEIIYAHQIFVDKTGFSLAQMIGQLPGKLWGGYMPKMFYYDMWQNISTKQKPFYDTVKNRKFSGEYYKDILSIIPIKDSARNQRLYIHLMPDDPSCLNNFRLDTLCQSFNAKNVTYEFIRDFFEIIHGDMDDSNSKILAKNFSLFSVSDFLYDFFIKESISMYSYRIDDFLLIKSAQFDKKTFSFLYQKYYRIISEYIKKRLIFTSDITSEDLTQEVFLRAFRAIDEFNCENASYKTYLLRIAHNILVDLYRHKKHFEYDNNLSDSFPSNDPCVVDTIYISGLLRDLSFFERDIFLRQHYYGYGLQEIADHYGISLDALKSRLKRIKAKLRKLK